MAISPPSDILLDVARAADPAQVRVATARLAKLAADPAASNEDFGKALVAARADLTSGAKGSDAPVRLAAAPVGGPSLSRQPTQSKDVYQKFEAILLQNFVESMLPKDDELYGDKNSADAYRSMMAEQLATQISKAGGIGIAKAVQSAHPGPTRTSALSTAQGVPAAGDPT